MGVPLPPGGGALLSAVMLTLTTTLVLLKKSMGPVVETPDKLPGFLFLKLPILTYWLREVFFQIHFLLIGDH